MKISDVLWKAANFYLAGNRAQYSCFAVLEASGVREKWTYYNGQKSFPDWFKTSCAAATFLSKLGLPKEYSPFADCADQHQCRYAWLMFAYEIAREVEAGKLKL